jgi:predicted deacylase
MDVMRAIGMLTARKRRRAPPEPFIARSTLWLRAPQSGILRSITHLGARVARGDRLGVVSDPFGEREEDVLATVSGLVIGRTNLPLVNEGEALFHIARMEELAQAAEAVEAFQAEFDPSTDSAPPREPPIV